MSNDKINVRVETNPGLQASLEKAFLGAPDTYRVTASDGQNKTVVESNNRQTAIDTATQDLIAKRNST